MIIGGLEPCSFVDFPGWPAVVVFTHGCNLRCRYCHNPQLLDGPPPRRITEDEVLAFLDRRRGKLGGLVVSGGEPTLQAGLMPFLVRVKAKGFLVKLDTNGTRPQVIEELLAERLVDHLAIDLKATPERAAWLCGSAEQPAGARRCLDLALAAGVEHEVRTTVVASVHTQVELEALAHWTAGTERWVLQRFRPGGHLDPSADLGVLDPALLARFTGALLRNDAGRATTPLVVATTVARMDAQTTLASSSPPTSERCLKTRRLPKAGYVPLTVDADNCTRQGENDQSTRPLDVGHDCRIRPQAQARAIR